MNSIESSGIQPTFQPSSKVSAGATPSIGQEGDRSGSPMLEAKDHIAQMQQVFNGLKADPDNSQLSVKFAVGQTAKIAQFTYTDPKTGEQSARLKVLCNYEVAYKGADGQDEKVERQAWVLTTARPDQQGAAVKAALGYGNSVTAVVDPKNSMHSKMMKVATDIQKFGVSVNPKADWTKLKVRIGDPSSENNKRIKLTIGPEFQEIGENFKGASKNDLDKMRKPFMYVDENGNETSPPGTIPKADGHDLVKVDSKPKESKEAEVGEGKEDIEEEGVDDGTREELEEELILQEEDAQTIQKEEVQGEVTAKAERQEDLAEEEAAIKEEEPLDALMRELEAAGTPRAKEPEPKPAAEYSELDDLLKELKEFAPPSTQKSEKLPEAKPSTARVSSEELDALAKTLKELADKDRTDKPVFPTPEPPPPLQP